MCIPVLVAALATAAAAQPADAASDAALGLILYLNIQMCPLHS